jgi:hypothetical protein
MFWFMVGCAMLLSHLLIAPGVLETSPLNLVLGYNNICVYWDYPAVESKIAMLYPFVEIPLVSYVALLQWRWQTIYHTNWFTKSIGTVFGLAALLCTLWFRMIFVHKAFDDPLDEPAKWPKHPHWAAPDSVFWHTLPFWGLQFALAIVAIQNYWFYIVLDAEHSKLDPNVEKKRAWGGGPWSYAYIVGIILVTITKLTYGYCVYSGYIAVVIPGSNPVTPTTIGVFGRYLDTAWMIMAAVIPLILAFVRYKDDSLAKLQISFGNFR